MSSHSGVCGIPIYGEFITTLGSQFFPLWFVSLDGKWLYLINHLSTMEI